MIYELCAILNAQLDESDTDSEIEKISEMLTGGGAEITATSKWGRRKLAYEINKKTEGFYIVIFFTLANPGDTLKNLEKACGYNDNVMRVMITKLPTQKQGREVKPFIPDPGYMAEFSMKLTAQGPRRRHDAGRGGSRYGARPSSEPSRPPEESAGENKEQTAAASTTEPKPAAAVSTPEPEPAATVSTTEPEPATETTKPAETEA